MLVDSISLQDMTDDQFFGGALDIYQPKQGFRSGMDAVFLSSSIPDLGAFKVLEAGCGAGVVSLAIAKRCDGAKVDGLEIEPQMAEIARINANRNKLDKRVSIFTTNVTEQVTKLEAIGITSNSYDFVVANPPFYQESEALVSDNALRRRANAGGANLLDEWMRFLTAMAAPNGKFSLIHRADRLDDILRAAKGRFGDICVFPLFPKKGEPANRVIVQGRKGSRAPMRLLEGMILHDEKGKHLASVQELSLQLKVIEFS